MLAQTTGAIPEFKAAPTAEASDVTAPTVQRNSGWSEVVHTTKLTSIRPHEARVEGTI
jgi:hypothetical protein